MRSAIKTLKLSISCFALSACALFGKDPTPQKVDLKWHIFEVVPGEPMACLQKEDVIALRKALIECGNSREK